MKKIIFILTLIFITGCSALKESLGNRNFINSTESFQTYGTTIGSLEYLKSGFNYLPISVEGATSFDAQAKYAIDNYSYVLNLKNPTLLDLKKLEVLLALDNIYNNLSEETKILIKYKPTKNYRVPFATKSVATFKKKSFSEYTRSELIEWYSLFERNSFTSEIKSLITQIKNFLTINVSINFKNFWGANSNERFVIEKSFYQSTGPMSTFYYYQGTLENNSTDIVVDLYIDDVEDFAYRYDKRSRYDKLIILEERRVRVSGTYDIISAKTGELLGREFFSEYGEYDIEYQLRGGVKYYERNRFEKEDTLEEISDEILNDIFKNIQYIVK